MIRIGNKVVAGSADVDLSTVLKSLNKTGLSIWIGTQTEHDALDDSIKNNEKTTFITYDTDEDIYLIIDTIISYGKTWSSVKISSELAKKINAADVYTKTQVDEIISAKLASALKYRGTVNTTALLPASAENGDTYFVKADGFMYAYNATESDWDALGTVADMTNYFTKAEITAMLQDKADKFQYDVLPTPSSETVGVLLQYTGADTQDYKNGYWYKGVDNGDDTYDWELAKTGDYYSKSEIDSSVDKRIELTGAIDLNEYYANGKYIARNGSGYTVTNAPSDLPYPNNGFSLEVMSYGASEGNTDAFCTQMLTAYTSSTVWVRSRYWGSSWFQWSNWQKLAPADGTLNPIHSLSDANSATADSSIKYAVSSDITANLPTDISVLYGLLETSQNSVGNALVQTLTAIYYGTNNEALVASYHRSAYYSGTNWVWDNWQRLVTKSDLPAATHTYKKSWYVGSTNTVTIDIASFDIVQYQYFTLELLGFYGPALGSKYCCVPHEIKNGTSSVTMRLAYKIDSASDPVSIVWTGDGSKLTAVTLETVGELNTIGVKIEVFNRNGW